MTRTALTSGTVRSMLQLWLPEQYKCQSIPLLCVQQTARHLTARLKVKAELDVSTNPSGIKVSEEELQLLHVHPAKFHSDWNYAIEATKTAK